MDVTSGDFLEELVEDGTGKPTAKTYISVEDADSFLLGRSDWEKASVEAKMFAVAVASLYADARWSGLLAAQSVVNSDQGLALPRTPITLPDGRRLAGIPAQWKFAVALYALYEVQGGVWPKTAVQQANIKTKRVTVGPITTMTSYEATASDRTFIGYPEADALIRGLFSGLSGQGRTIRA